MVYFFRKIRQQFLWEKRISKYLLYAVGEVFGLDRGRFLLSHIRILTSPRFDNRLLGFIYSSGYLAVWYAELKEQIEKIIGIIDSQIKN